MLEIYFRFIIVFCNVKGRRREREKERKHFPSAVSISINRTKLCSKLFNSV